MWGMTAMKKGTAMKDKKKRAGGGSPPPPAFVFCIAPLSSIASAGGQSGWTHSGLDVVVADVSVVPPSVVNDVATGVALGAFNSGTGQFTKIAVDDAAATALASSPASLIHNASTQTANFVLPAGADLILEYESSISPGSNHGTVRQVFYQIDAIHDPNSLAANNHIRLHSGPFPHTSAIMGSQSSTFRDVQVLDITGGGGQINAGDEIIIEVTAGIQYLNKGIPSHNMTRETLSNLTGGTASATESMYIKLNFV